MAGVAPRSLRFIALSLGLFGVAGCKHAASPEAAADQYRRAWKQGDADTLWKLSDASFRGRVGEARLRAFLAEAPLLVPSTATATVVMVSARISYADGVTLELVHEGEAWRVRAGGADPDQEAEPLGALRRFLAAVLAGDLETVRRFMPAQALASFGRDEDLLRHLVSEQGRARDLLHRLSAGPVDRTGQGEQVELRYAPGRAVRLAREAGTWRVLDLE